MKSEHANKTLNQCLRIAVESHTQGWVKALPCIRFNMMNTTHASTRFSGFQLHLGFSPHLIPPIAKEPLDDMLETPLQFIEWIAQDIGTVVDNLVEQKILQAHQANKYRTDDFPFHISDEVLLSAKNLTKETTLSTP